jgi:hypothetical protein
MALFVVTCHSEGGAVCSVSHRGWRSLLLCITQRLAQFVVTYHSEGGEVCCNVSLRGWRYLLCITQRMALFVVTCQSEDGAVFCYVSLRMAQFVVANVSWRHFTSVLLTHFPLEWIASCSGGSVGSRAEFKQSCLRALVARVIFGQRLLNLLVLLSPWRSLQPLTWSRNSLFVSQRWTSFGHLVTIVFKFCTACSICRPFDDWNSEVAPRFFENLSILRSRGSVVGIATRYGLEGPGIESRWGEIFRTYTDWLRGPTSLMYNGYRVFPGGKGGRGVMLTTHPLLVLRLKKSWAIPPLTLWVLLGLLRGSLSILGLLARMLSTVLTNRPCASLKSRVVKTCVKGKGVTQRILKFVSKFKWIVSFTPRPPYSWGRNRGISYPITDLDRSLGLQEVEARRICRESVREGGKTPFAPPGDIPGTHFC